MSYTKQNIPCMFCGNGSKNKKTDKKAGACTPSRFPCLQVQVEFTANGKFHEGLIHPDSLQADSKYGETVRIFFIMYVFVCFQSNSGSDTLCT